MKKGILAIAGLAAIAIDHSAISPYLLRSLVFSGANIESFWLMTKLFFTIYFKTLIIKEKN